MKNYQIDLTIVRKGAPSLIIENCPQVPNSGESIYTNGEWIGRVDRIHWDYGQVAANGLVIKAFVHLAM